MSRKHFQYLFLALAALPVCVPAVSRAAEAEKPLNVIVICLNALRADHLKIYGYGTETAPNITEFSESAAVFDSAAAQSHWTLPSLASLFTSRYVHSLGLYKRGDRLSEKETTLAETLKANGYATAAFTGGLDMSGVYGLRQGFDIYFDDTGKKAMGSFAGIMPHALDWLAARKDGKFFLFLDSYDIHPPFDKPGAAADDYAGPLKGLTLDYSLLKGFKDGSLRAGGREIRLSAADLGYIRSRYDAGIAQADRQIGVLLAKLAELGLAENTLVVLASEHGEELADHGGFDRFGSENLYEETVRIPLLIKNPRLQPGAKRVAAQAQLIDIMPTVLEILGLPGDGRAQGRSLVPLMGNAAADGDFNRSAYSEAGFRKWAVRSGGWKLIYNAGQYSLYDLARDPGETENLAAKEPSRVYGLVQDLMRWRRRTRTDKSPDDTKVTVSEEMKRKLKEAGYWR